VLAAARAMAAKRRLEVDSDNERASLGTAKAAVVTAQRAIEKKAPIPSDDEFAELNTAITVLDKTLQGVHQKEPLMAGAVADVTAVLAAARAMAAKRRLEVDVEKQHGKVEDARKIAAEAMKQMAAPTFGKEQIQQAESAVKLVGTVLEQGAELTQRDKGYAFYDGEVKKRLAELNDKIAARKIVLAANDARAALNESIASLKTKIDVAKTPEAKDSDVDAAQQNLDAINKMLETNAPLEKQNGTYAAAAEKARNQGFVLVDLLDFAKQARELRKKTGEALMAGSTGADSAASVTDLRKRKGQYEKALGEFRACQTEGPPLLAANPQLAKIPVLVSGASSTPREVIATCTQRLEATEQLMKDVLPLIKFEDGPKKSYELAKGFLDKSKKTEALAQLNECIATGAILKNDNPELADKPFTVAGGTMTLGEVIKACVAQKKTLQGK
jgi:hypothetical protein